MWWYFVKQEDTPDYVIYAYGMNSRETTGKVKYDRKTVGTYEILKYAENDTQEHAERFAVHYYSIAHADFPATKLIAIG